MILFASRISSGGGSSECYGGVEESEQNSTAKGWGFFDFLKKQEML